MWRETIQRQRLRERGRGSGRPVKRKRALARAWCMLKEAASAKAAQRLWTWARRRELRV
jgi:hypothetical protein